MYWCNFGGGAAHEHGLGCRPLYIVVPAVWQPYVGAVKLLNMVRHLARCATVPLRLLAPPRRTLVVPEEFYRPPDPLPPGMPGDVIRVAPMDAYLVPGIRFRVRAWRVLYRSTSATGEPTAVSGSVLIPVDKSRAARPLVGYAVGTHGIADTAAPSRLLTAGTEWEAGLISLLLARGWAVAITDYQGLGTPGDHTYMVGRALGRNVLDVMRAARWLEPLELSLDGSAAVIGYSEGGAAAAWAAELQPTYAPDVPLAAVAAGAAAANMETAGTTLAGTPYAFFIAYGGIGYSAAYPELDLDAILTARARAAIGTLRQSSLLEAMVLGTRFAYGSEMSRPPIFELPQWNARLRENSLGRTAPAAPVLLHHARRDQIVSFAQSAKLRDDWERRGADVRLYVTRGGVDHISGALAGTPVAVSWIARRLVDAQQRRGAVQPRVVRALRPIAAGAAAEAA